MVYALVSSISVCNTVSGVPTHEMCTAHCHGASVQATAREGPSRPLLTSLPAALTRHDLLSTLTSYFRTTDAVDFTTLDDTVIHN